MIYFFIKNEKGKAEAMQGKHDDLIMGIAIAYGVRHQQSLVDEIIVTEKKKFNLEEYEERMRKRQYGDMEGRFMEW